MKIELSGPRLLTAAWSAVAGATTVPATNKVDPGTGSLRQTILDE